MLLAYPEREVGIFCTMNVSARKVTRFLTLIILRGNLILFVTDPAGFIDGLIIQHESY